MTLTKAKTVYRIICPNFGPRHRTHAYTKKGMNQAEAEARAEAQDRHYRALVEFDTGPEHPYYRQEIGWKVQMQTVTEWENIE